MLEKTEEPMEFLALTEGYTRDWEIEYPTATIVENSFNFQFFSTFVTYVDASSSALTIYKPLFSRLKSIT
jgi:hypothetical protein